MGVDGDNIVEISFDYSLSQDLTISDLEFIFTNDNVETEQRNWELIKIDGSTYNIQFDTDEGVKSGSKISV